VTTQVLLPPSAVTTQVLLPPSALTTTIHYSYLLINSGTWYNNIIQGLKLART